MNKPDILGVEVMTPDGLGSILSLNTRRVIVSLNKIYLNQVMKGASVMKGQHHRPRGMHYAYKYEDVTIIKGQYCINIPRLKFQYDFVQPSPTDSHE